MDWIDYREKLGIGFSDNDKATYFMTRMFNALDNYSDRTDLQINGDEYFAFCNMTGTSLHIEGYWRAGDEYRKIINVLQKNSQSLKQFLAYYVAFINSQNDRSSKPIQKEYYIKLVRNMLEESHIPYELLEDGGQVFIFPKGAAELDKALVSEPLEWLKGFPTAHKTYCIALRQYADGIYIRDVADNLRKALEAFLQEFLQNDKNLETNKIEICRHLGQQGVDSGISGLFQPLINAYKTINDRIAKHHDAVDKKLLEFLLYQTGILIRMVLAVENAA